MAQLGHVNVHDHLAETLERLSKKSGVLATIALDRASGAILKTSGSLIHTRSSSQIVGADNSAAFKDDVSKDTREEDAMAGMASMVWNFLNVAGTLVEGLDAEDEIKLLRLRTKKAELVIVPDSKYLLVVVHETPAT